MHRLFEEGAYEECQNSASIYLLFNKHDVEARFLKARCEFEMALSGESDANYIEQYTIALKSFEDILEIQPLHTEALTWAAYILIYILQTDLCKAVNYCNTLEKSEGIDIKIEAINYRREAHYLSGDADAALYDTEILILLTSERYKASKSDFDRYIGNEYLFKARIYQELKFDIAKALTVFKEGFCYAGAARPIDIFIAKLAFENNDPDFGTEAYLNSLTCEFQGDRQCLMDVYHHARTLMNNGYYNTRLYLCVVSTIRQLGSEVFGENYQHEVFALSKEYITILPQAFEPYHFAAAILFENKDYDASLSYSETSLHLGGWAISIARYVATHYYVHDWLPIVQKWPDDLPAEYFNAGNFFLYNFENHIEDSEISRDFKQLRKNFYERAYDGFYDYFYKGIGSSRNANQIHTFAMCCNNYGIVLTELGEYEKAVEVHELGYSLSPFWEQLSSWAYALTYLARPDDAVPLYIEAASYSREYLSFEDYLDLQGRAAMAFIELDRTDEAFQLLIAVDKEYDYFITLNKNKLSRKDLLEIDEKYIEIQNALLDLTKDLSLEDSIKFWHVQLEKNPDNNPVWFILMKQYYWLEDFNECITCANNYLLLKGEFIGLGNKLEVTYMRGISYYNIGDYLQAVKDLRKNVKNIDVHLWNPVVESNVYIWITRCLYALQEWDECKKYGWEAIECYNKNQWEWEDELVLMMLHYADACRATGQKDVAIGTVENVLHKLPGNKEALQRKKEWKEGGLFSFLKTKL